MQPCSCSNLVISQQREIISEENKEKESESKVNLQTPPPPLLHLLIVFQHHLHRCSDPSKNDH